MKKIRTNVTLNEDVFKKAKKYNIIISSFLEIRLREYIALIEGKKPVHSDVTNPASSNTEKSMDWTGFEPVASTLRRWRSSADLPAPKHQI